jgi:hypothetical protein
VNLPCLSTSMVCLRFYNADSRPHAPLSQAPGNIGALVCPLKFYCVSEWAGWLHSRCIMHEGIGASLVPRVVIIFLCTDPQPVCLLFDCVFLCLSHFLRQMHKLYRIRRAQSPSAIWGLCIAEPESLQLWIRCKSGVNQPDETCNIANLWIDSSKFKEQYKTVDWYLPTLDRVDALKSISICALQIVEISDWFKICGWFMCIYSSIICCTC